MLRQRPLRAGQSAEERQAWITDLSIQLNHLESDERQRVLLDPEMRRAAEKMTEEERLQYLELASAKGVSKMAEAFGTAPAFRQQNVMNKALSELDELRPGSKEVMEKILEPDEMDRITKKGLAQYLREADSLTRIELQPFVERIQNIRQEIR